MKTIIISLFMSIAISSAKGQAYSQYNSIPGENIDLGAGGTRDGSCASPDGPIICDALDGYPTFAELEAGDC